MTPDGTVTVLYAFTGGATDGIGPRAPLIRAMDGNFYGTTSGGGGASGGGGTVFRMTPDGNVAILHAFAGGTDGQFPETALIQATDGSLYGTNDGDFGSNGGTVFRVTSDGTYTVLHDFVVDTDGSFPSALVQASDGNFYGTNASGGGLTQGTVFQMAPDGTVIVLHAFAGPDGDGASPSPFSGLIQATDGNFYGTTQLGASFPYYVFGTVFTMTPAGAVAVLHDFSGDPDSLYGVQPAAALVQGTDGNFYGTTPAPSGGTVFQIAPDGTPTLLHQFAGADGGGPSALLQAADGKFYGTTLQGGPSGLGVVFRLTMP
jgi:uncharacterized repeat protein (TIGR03803 family)